MQIQILESTTMKFNVAQQLKEGIGSVRYYDIDDTDDEGNPIRGKVQFLCTNRSILVTGKMDTSVKGECSRCLERFQYPLKMNLEEELFLTIDHRPKLALSLSTRTISWTSARRYVSTRLWRCP
jgi:uncharacterized metal-binding protein YceD (DUF177 family)